MHTRVENIRRKKGSAGTARSAPLQASESDLVRQSLLQNCREYGDRQILQVSN